MENNFNIEAQHFVSIKRIEYLLEQILSIQAQQFAVATNRNIKETTEAHFSNVQKSLESYCERLGLNLNEP